MSSREIRCPHCGEWNHIQGEPLSCGFCGKPLGHHGAEEEASLERRRTSWEIKTPIYQDDYWIVKFFKHIYNAVAVVFVAVVGFIMWLIAMSPG